MTGNGRWTIVPSRNYQAPNGQLSQLACWSSTVCEAVGNYGTKTVAEGWNGTSWALQATPIPAEATDSWLYGVACSSPTDCEAVGYYYAKSNVYVALAEGWNGSSWALQSTPNHTNSYLVGVACSSPTVCEAVGHTTSGVQAPLAEGWNGTSWTLQSTPNPTGPTPSSAQPVLDAVACSSSTDCEAVGSYIGSSTLVVTLAERWNGSSWALQSTPNPRSATNSQLAGVACSSSTHCEAVGSSCCTYIRSDYVHVALAERWNGSTWALQPIPKRAFNSSLNGVACWSSTACETIGSYSNESNDRERTLAEGWNGTSWAVQATPNPTHAVNSYLDGVACSSPTVCVTIGSYDKFSSVPVTLEERWNGTSWALQATPNPVSAIFDSLDGVACSSPTDCEAVGEYAFSTLAERWNGTKWLVQATPDPTRSTFRYLHGVACASSTACEAVGQYFDIGSGDYLTLAEGWNGTKWALQATPNQAAPRPVTCTGWRAPHRRTVKPSGTTPVTPAPTRWRRSGTVPAGRCRPPPIPPAPTLS